MRKLTHLLLRKPRSFPPLNPRPRPDIRNTILPLATSRKILLHLPIIPPTQLYLQHVINPQRLIPEPINRQVGLLGLIAEVIGVSLVWCARAVPEEEPLEALAAFEGIGEAEFVLR